MHSGAFQIPGIMSDEDVVWFVKQLWFYAMQYYRFCGDILRRDNHHLVDHGHGPLILGIMFPEFSVSRALVRSGRKVRRPRSLEFPLIVKSMTADASAGSSTLTTWKRRESAGSF